MDSTKNENPADDIPGPFNIKVISQGSGRGEYEVHLDGAIESLAPIRTEPEPPSPDDQARVFLMKWAMIVTGVVAILGMILLFVLSILDKSEDSLKSFLIIVFMGVSEVLLFALGYFFGSKTSKGALKRSKHK